MCKMKRNMFDDMMATRRQVFAGAAAFSLFGVSGCKSLFGQQKIKLALMRLFIRKGFEF